ncbi:MAG TPA: ABC transporter transmembrane domain-containing protein, partial [Candidatus Sulfotelmatobacter sp.]|nr:ABC transporter transmembrane domain-containing protein [Candidatus Sulfotelmatobacter sp.]
MHGPRVHIDDEALGKALDLRLVFRLLAFIRPHAGLVALAFALLAGYTAAQLLGPYLVKVALDRYVAAHDVAGLDRVALAYLAAVLAAFLCQFGQSYATQCLGQRVMHDVRCRLFDHLQ